ncbi:MAG TPA: hypothetical protein VJ914_31895 [Pseudonocardiaceae bacterium]|nr:hypothetical protein [Pseudonocardiaceae bacterium]
MRTEQLRDVIGDRGPFVSVYVDASHDTEDALTKSELRWRAAETRLWDVGADQATIEATRQAVLDPPAVGRSGRAVIAARGQVLLTEDFPVPPAADVVRWSELPYLLPLLSAVDPPVPHVVVLADKIGGHLRAIDGHGDPVSDTATHGAEQPLHHVSGGGLAHGSMENRSEETVRRNARDTADLAVRLAARVDAELVILAGTVSARTAIHAELPHHVKKITAELDVNAAHTDLDSAEVNDGVARLLAQRQAERDEAVLERWHVGSAHGNACEGLGKVTEALRSGAVETILVTDPSLSERTVWRGSDPSQVATDRAEFPEAAECRADEAVPAAALATSADVLVLTGAATLTDGIAALLRF